MSSWSIYSGRELSAMNENTNNMNLFLGGL